MILAKQSTAITVTVGPVLDADGVAVTNGVVGDFKISKNGGAPAALNGSATLTHRNTGHYSLALTASDVDTVGTVEIVIDDTTNACAPKELQVVEEAIYDAIYAASATGLLPANVTQWAGSAVATPTVAGVPEVDVTHVGGSAEDIATETKQNTAQADLDILTGTDGVTLATSQPNYTPATSAQATAIESDTQDLQTQIGTAGAGLTALGDTRLGNLDAAVSTRLASASYTAPLDAAGTRTAVGLASANLDTQLGNIVADTNELQADWADGGRLDLILDARASQTSVDDVPTVAEFELRTISEAAADRLERSALAIAICTVGSGSTTTSIVTSACSPAGAVADQFKGRIVIFDKDTTTAALRGQATDITASSNSATPTLTVTALTTAPSSGDTFTIT